MADVERFRAMALLLAQGSTLRDAAREAGVAERSAYRVAQKPGFRRLVKRARSRLWKALAGKLVAASEAAVAELVRMATADGTPATARVSACRAILENALRVKDAADVERRLAALEGREDAHAAVD